MSGNSSSMGTLTKDELEKQKKALMKELYDLQEKEYTLWSNSTFTSGSYNTNESKTPPKVVDLQKKITMIKDKISEINEQLYKTAKGGRRHRKIKTRHAKKKHTKRSKTRHRK